MIQKRKETKQIEITITHTCNLKPRCPGCSDEAATRHGKKDKSAEFWCQRLDELYQKYKFSFVILMGGEPTFWPRIEKLTSHIAQSKNYDGGFYTDSVGLLTKNGEPTEKLKSLIEKGRLPKLYLLASIDYLIEKPDSIWENAARLKAYHGLRLLKFLRKEYPHMALALHQVIKPDTLEHTLPLYKKALELGVWFSCCTFVWKQYVYGRKNTVSIENYQNLILKDEHREKLAEISKKLINKETKRLKNGLGRSIAVSRAFLQQLSKNGIDQGYSCIIAGQPNMFDVTAQGEVRFCVARDTEEEGLACSGCSFVCLDRGGRYEPLEEFSGEKKEITWMNLLQSRKNEN
jgi:MoaA/NifB/PqqE/SkfB family radical SAM enzyme